LRIRYVQWADIDFRPSDKKLRQFAGLWLGFFLVLAAWQAYRQHTTVAAIFAASALTIGPLGLLSPGLMRPIFVGWTVLAFPIGWVVSNTILALLFFGLFTPVALVFRLIGRDALSLRRRPEASSYWTPKPRPASVRRYLQPF
jgi:hypothetical protein